MSLSKIGRPSLFLAALLAAGAVAGCASVRPPAPPAGVFADRPTDGLLVRPDLQALVDAQVRRDAAPLVAALQSANADVRARAAFALASVQSADAVDALLEALRDDTPAVRADAAFALGQSADSTRGVALLIALRDEATPAVQAELLGAIGKVGDDADVADLLRVTLAQAVEPARARALARLAMRGESTPASIAYSAARLGAPDPALRIAAAQAFERAPVAAWRDALPAIRAAFDGLPPADPARTSLARALARTVEAQDVPRLAAALTNAATGWRTRVTAAGALGALRAEPAARMALVSALDADNPHVAGAAAAALARVDTPSAAELAAATAAVQNARRPWQATAPLLPVLARAGRLDAVAAWSARNVGPFAQTAHLAALGEATTPATLDVLFARATDSDARLAAAAVEALRARWASTDSLARPAAADRYYGAFSAALSRRDLATTTSAAPALSDSLFVLRGSSSLLQSVYAQMTAPEDVEPMVEIVRALGQIRDAQEIEFLVGVALTGHPVLRAAARDALNERLTEGIDVSANGTDGATETTGIDWAYLARVGPRPHLVLDTDRGRVVIEMVTEGAPQTVQTVAQAAAAGRYDGVPFHRVVSNFVVQGGDFFRRDGYGGPDIPIRSEFTRLRFETGTAGIASAGKDTEGVQYFVTHSPQPHLDGKYTAFGRVVSGQDVVDRMLQGDVVRRAHIERP